MSDTFMVLTVLFLVFIFEGDPDIYDKAHAKAITYLSE
mgnify:FL=1